MPFLTFCIGRASWSIWQSLLHLLLFYSPSQETCPSLKAAGAAARGAAILCLSKALNKQIQEETLANRESTAIITTYTGTSSASPSGNRWALSTCGDPNTCTPLVETEGCEGTVCWGGMMLCDEKYHSTTAKGRVTKRQISCPNTGAQISATNETWVSHSHLPSVPLPGHNLHLWSFWPGVQCQWPKDSFIDQWGSQFWQISDNWQIHPKWYFQNGNLMNKYA